MWIIDKKLLEQAFMQNTFFLCEALIMNEVITNTIDKAKGNKMAKYNRIKGKCLLAEI